eukprot:CAMPEP_0196580910 /NCGR_PEP_ID=MMETSP1081-20130531/31465_1 /TAXON_ID=36882 /ORGANISM="Pyramimonas amylifera, Strain CCMP720" /LENGTH=109 /DNA_ID=CAMNT_0041900941 /DNA_START=140 /DNA_END=466 /DNA_ORIENTATION=+
MAGCSKETPKLSQEQIAERLKSLPFWKLNETGDSISKKFVAKNWMAAMSFFNAVTEIAEAESHHPDLHLTSYRNVQVDMSTHAINGLSEIDMDMAAKIDVINVEYSPKW